MSPHRRVEQRPKGRMRARNHKKSISCGKRRFKDSISAHLALTTITNIVKTPNRDTPVRAYFHVECHGWHLTSMASEEYDNSPRKLNKV